MTERVLGPTGGRRRKRLALLVPVVAIAALIMAIGAFGGASTDSHFEGNDANLVVDTPATEMDWNGFAAVSWTGDAPYRSATKTTNGWKFVGIEDAQDDQDDTVFAGGVKQDDECADVNSGPKPPNKDDLKRIYLASKIVNNDVFLALAWARIPQNSTSASAHVAFEFNQLDPDVAGNLCGGDADGLVKRSTANGGDMLIVYDFEGGSAPAILKLLRWKTSGTCEQTGKAATADGCWVFQVLLTATGDAEARVNTEDAADAIAPGAPPSDTLHTQEFGEAIINLSDAGVFSGTSCLTFGTVFAVSRSSGNSGQAQMKDLVGPGDSGLTNCGSITIIKETIPAGQSVNFPFTSNIATNSAGSGFSCLIGATSDSTPNNFTLNDGAAATDDIVCTNVKAGSYSVSEDTPLPAGWGFDSLSNCSGTGGSSVTQVGSTAAVNITLTGGGSVTCTFKNKQLTGAIQVRKEAKNVNCAGSSPPDGCDASNNAPLAGAGFEIWQETNGCTNLQTTATDCIAGGSQEPADTKVKNEQLTVISGTGASTVATTCFSDLAFNTSSSPYYVHESSPPSGYSGGGDQIQVVQSASTCAGSPALKVFSNVPLSKITVSFESLGAGNPTSATIQCSGTPDLPGGDDSSATNLPEGTPRVLNNLPEGTYDCQVVIDP